MKRSRVSSLAAVVFAAVCVTALVARDPSPGIGAAGADSKLSYTGSVLIQLRVADLDRAVVFYTKTLGFELLLRNDELRWAKVQPPGGRAVIGLGAGAEIGGSGSLSMNIGVRDIDTARTTLAHRGVSFKSATITIPGVVKLADFEDPDGHRIRLAESLDPAVD